MHRCAVPLAQGPERFADVDADVEHHPVLLVPDCPNEGIEIADFLKERYSIANPESTFARRCFDNPLTDPRLVAKNPGYSSTVWRSPGMPRGRR